MNALAALSARTKRLAVGAALLAALIPAPALCDEQAAAANRLALEQVIDVASTLSIIHNGGTERDPFATPFIHSPMTQVAAAVGLNLVARRLPIRILRTVVTVYPFVLLGNAHAIGMHVDAAGLVRRNR